jgi:hypothetical protein
VFPRSCISLNQPIHILDMLLYFAYAFCGSYKMQGQHRDDANALHWCRRAMADIYSALPAGDPYRGDFRVRVNEVTLIYSIFVDGSLKHGNYTYLGRPRPD